MTRPVFHLSFPVRSLAEAKQFYRHVLGASIGRDTGTWADLLLFGHQLTVHERPAEVLAPDARGVRHFGAILPWSDWEALAERIRGAGWPFATAPAVQHTGSSHEQGKFLISDPSDNLIEFKAYRDFGTVFGVDDAG